MTLITPFEDDGTADESLAAAEELLKEVGLALADLSKKIRQDDVEAGRAAKAVLSEFTHARNMASRERIRVVDERKKGAGIVGDYAIDFDAARDEIGRRLDCLRAASDG